jgi:hypothetical protein
VQTYLSQFWAVTLENFATLAQEEAGKATAPTTKKTTKESR